MLKFAPLVSDISPGFWTVAGRKKLEEWHLDESPKEAVGHLYPAKPAGQPGRLVLGVDAFSEHHSRADDGSFSLSVPLRCELRNCGTKKGFKDVDKQGMLDEAGAELYRAIASEEGPTEPSTLMPCFILSFLDLKRHKHIFWVAVPALVPPEPITAATSRPLSEAKDAAWIESVESGMQRLSRAARHLPLLAGIEEVADGGPHVYSWADTVAALDQSADWDRWTLAVLDSSPTADVQGWPLRNLAACVSLRWRARRVQCLTYRPFGTRLLQPAERADDDVCASGTLLELLLPPPPPSPSSHLPSGWRVVGWEPNARGQLAPRVADLSALMASDKQAEAALTLNLKLMRWRMLPGLDIDRLRDTKCLLLGAGTLGCYVARSLLGWGVSTITFVDSGRVSLSNPVRQPLFEFRDAERGGKPKAAAAAEALSRVAPHVTTRGVNLSIPMPGHAVGSDEAAAAQADAVGRLDALVREHDVVFLLTDSRESRWLPTVMAAAHGKPAINIALGFDTFLVMRHGVPGHTQAGAGAGGEGGRSASPLGCYFCSDVVAPENSLADRTLDQMCTVTRAGLAPVASAWGVELMVAVLHHPQGWAAPHEGDQDLAATTPSPLGIAPHQIRGFQRFFKPLLLESRRFHHCIACNEDVLQAYRSGGAEFVRRVCDDPAHAEELSGVAEMKRAMEAAAAARSRQVAEGGEEGEGEEDEWEDLM